MKNKKIQWFIAIYLLIGVLYALFNFIKPFIGFNSVTILGKNGFMIFLTNIVFFPFIIIFEDIMKYTFRYTLWWILIPIVFLIYILYWIFSKLHNIFKIKKEYKHIILVSISLILMLFLIIPTTNTNENFVPKQHITYKNVIENIDSIIDKDEYYIAKGFSFNVIKPYKEISKYDYFIKWFKETFVIRDDYDYFGKDSSKYRLYNKSEEEQIKIQNEKELNDWENKLKLNKLENDELNIYFVSQKIMKYESGNGTYGFINYDNNNTIYINYDFTKARNNESNDEYFGSLDNTLVHELSHYMDNVGYIDNKDVVYGFVNDKIQSEKYWIDLFDNNHNDIPEYLQESVNFSNVFQIYFRSDYENEIIARINALCINVDKYNEVFVNNYSMCNKFNFPITYIESYNRLFNNLVYGFTSVYYYNINEPKEIVYSKDVGNYQRITIVQ